MVEMTYHLQLNSAMGSELQFMGMALDAKSLDTWFGAGLVTLVGLALFELTRRAFLRDWGQVQSEIEKEIKRRETL
jgi:branched-chain amino acid transport system permease protein